MTVTASSRDAAVWRLFEDWCAALEYRALPADPLALARFISANPASGATQRRRVSAINAAHRRAGHPCPGQAEAIRELLDARRIARTEARAAAAAQAITHLPKQGWPTTLFAGRDSVLLVLSTTSMPARHIAALRIGDVHGDAHGSGLTANAAGRAFTSPEALSVHGISAAHVLREWLRVRSIQHHTPSTMRLAAYLRGEPVPRVPAAPDSLPLVTPVDRWGATPLLPTPLSAASVARIITDHLSGAAIAHREVTRAVAETKEAEPAAPEPPLLAPVLDPASFSRGIAARQRTSRELDDVSVALDDVEARADRLLDDLLRLLDSPDMPQLGDGRS